MLINCRRIMRIIFIISIVCLMASGAVAADMIKVDLNKGTAEEFVQLQKIGKTIAERIVEYREKNGPFQTIDEIMKVKGIGEKTFELIKSQLVIE